MGAEAPLRRLQVPADVAALIRGLHPGIKKKVRAALKVILDDPECGKALKEELSGLRSYRLGRFRIVYRAREDCLIEVLAVGPRKVIYQETYRRIRREKT